MENKRHCFIFDLDGTLANIEHRLHCIRVEEGRKPDWNRFNELCIYDTPILPVVNMARLLADTHHIVICSGRMATKSVSDKTQKWLKLNHITYSALYMREENDYRPDHIIKEECYNQIVLKYFIAGVFDDRKSVVDMWRSKGLICYQVADEAF